MTFLSTKFSLDALELLKTAANVSHAVSAGPDLYLDVKQEVSVEVLTSLLFLSLLITAESYMVNFQYSPKMRRDPFYPSY